jgi:D-alanyl-D-alanine carboxypeptidase/D-alanyl-D-alanine-endopeptidase (penicillin-binding protein 4)
MVLVIGGCGGSTRPTVTTTTTVRRHPRGAAPVRHVSPVHRARPARKTASQPGAVSLRLALLAAMRGAGPQSGAAVYDLTDHRTLFAMRGNAGHPPASVEKLYTTAAVLRTLGPAATLQTQVFGIGQLGAHGVWHGNLYVKGGGDPTLGDALFNHSYESGFGPTGSQIAEQVYSHGIRRVTGHLFGDESLFDIKRGPLSTDYRPDIPDLGGELSALAYDHGSVVKVGASPAVFATEQLAAAMRTAHITVRAAGRTALTPVGATPLATVSSPPMQVMLRLMDVPSDVFAEMLTKQLGVRFGGGEGTIAAGADVIGDTIASDYGIHPRIVDGSGLSRRDRSSPSEVVTLLRELWGTATGQILFASLPVVGKTGTVTGVAVKTAAVGRCSAKTGTLNYVTNLAGYCHTKGGHELAFAFFDDGPSNGTAIALEGQMVADLAKY